MAAKTLSRCTVTQGDLEPLCLWAHSAPDEDRARHLLADHLYCTAALAARFDLERRRQAVEGQLPATIGRVSGLVPEIMQRDVMALPPWFAAVPPDERLLAAELLTRMVASAVYDADVLDTRRFIEQAQA